MPSRDSYNWQEEARKKRVRDQDEAASTKVHDICVPLFTLVLAGSLFYVAEARSKTDTYRKNIETLFPSKKTSVDESSNFTQNCLTEDKNENVDLKVALEREAIISLFETMGIDIKTLHLISNKEPDIS